MYLYKRIDIRLTKNYTELLRRPSKVFNKIKSLFSGEMTPTQQKQADVMLSVIQRLNVALRRSGFTRLASISVNNVLVFDCATQETTLEQSNATLVEGFNSGDFKQLDQIQLVIDGEDQALHYLLNVSIDRKPKHHDTPVCIAMYGFVKAFGKQNTESDNVFSQRVKALMAEQWGTEAQIQQQLDALENQFEQLVTRLSDQIAEHFPSGIEVSDTQKRKRNREMSSQHQSHKDRYDAVYSYLPLFYLYTEGVYAEGEDPFVLDSASSNWDRNTNVTVGTADDNSWADAIEVSDGGSSAGCGSGCGGGCGGG
ncbi:hypothetical protein DRW07_10875 [Alteromonas sediminis]|uniref:Uncharacterized protein n=1 Tax=Alteromonas sediminis TaxID=2259342 RepID=A0A3N5Y789_9ALTE|nr:hypothetical protein [Alteromonas sediminis]RPJ66579.1 hypothetical protein DRW07_10875 [Alteromonas sediminis]